MARANHRSHRGYLSSVVHNKCPRCREGDLFESSHPYHLPTVLKMNETCPVCGQPTEIEKGFYFGTGYVSYALAVAISVATLVAWWVLIGLQPLLMRLSRSIWISWFVRYDPEWEHPVKDGGAGAAVTHT